MKKLVHLLLCLFFFFATSETVGQKINLDLEYTITYLLPKTKDTLNISIANQGKYLYTDSELLANLFKSQFVSTFGSLSNESGVNFILNLAEMEMLFSLNSEKTSILMNLNLLDFLPKKDSVPNKLTQLVANENGQTISLMNNEYPLFEMYPQSDSEDKLIFAFDKDYNIDYAQNFTDFFKYVLGDTITFDIPNGIVVYIKDKNNQEIIKAIKIERETRKLSTDLNFYIK